MKDPALLYDEDFLAWTETQAKALRAAARGRANPRAGSNQPVANQPFDWEHLAEEIEGLGLCESAQPGPSHHSASAQARVLACCSARQGWIDSIDDARDMVARVLDASPSLRRELDAVIMAEQSRGARAAIRDLGRYGELDPNISDTIRNVRYDAEKIFDDWFPPESSAP